MESNLNLEEKISNSLEIDIIEKELKDEDIHIDEEEIEKEYQKIMNKFEIIDTNSNNNFNLS